MELLGSVASGLTEFLSFQAKTRNRCRNSLSRKSTQETRRQPTGAGRRNRANARRQKTGKLNEKNCDY
jgi:hypothetical protein